MTPGPLLIRQLHAVLSGMTRTTTPGDAEVLKSGLAYVKERLIPAIDAQKVSWESFLTFWPPRLLGALQAGKLACFFGAGLSIPSGLPTWSEMLRSYFGLDQAILADDDLQSDPLTQAELASHRLGADKVQALLRERLGISFPASTSHFLVAALRLPFYITTNYDSLFEQAWRKLNERLEIEVLTSDLDVSRIWGDQPPTPHPDCAYLFKIHGCLERPQEHLILTRSDYRRHYRSNDKFFSTVKLVLASYHVLFLGFSHKDPEVTRLVEDAIWQFEKREEERSRSPVAVHPAPLERPHFYSLQFSMQAHTPEIFAARGIVALSPPFADPAAQDIRSSSLTRGLADLLGASETGLADKVSLDLYLKELADAVTTDLKKALQLLEDGAMQATARLKAPVAPTEWLRDLQTSLGSLAGQGVYLLDHEGQVREAYVPPTLTMPERRTGPKEGFGNRPYFQQAKTYRQRFVSDFFLSMYNANLTFVLGLPLIDSKGFAGLLFAACQPGAWLSALDVARTIRNSRPGLSVLLVDANGVAMIPPNAEFEPEDSDLAKSKGESEGANLGFPYRKLLALSRSNKLIERIMENVIPLRQDDDVLPLGPDLRQYTVVTEISMGRWKLGISDSVFLSGKL